MTLNIPAKRLIEIADGFPRQVSIRKLKDLTGLAAMRSKNDSISDDDLSMALTDVLFNEDQMKIDFWTLLAIRMASYASLLPWRDETTVLPENIPDCLEDIVDKATGKIDATALDQKILELSRMVGV